MDSAGLTLEQKATNAETWEHIHRVQRLMGWCQRWLMMLSEIHDQSKLRSPEVEIFAKYTPKLAGCTYGSDEYKRYLEEMKPALEHHYKKNLHHPEHFPNGIYDMNLFQVMEMFCDWKAASERHNDGDIYRSIEINTARFQLSPQMAAVLNNTAKMMESA